MINKAKKVICVLCMVALLATSLMIGAMASCITGYGSYTLNIEDGNAFTRDKAIATLSRCSCTPVDNILMIWLRIQYYEDGHYYWSPEETNGQQNYYYVYEEDVDEVTKTLKAEDIRVAQARFCATCGDNPENVLIRSAYNNED